MPDVNFSNTSTSSQPNAGDPNIGKTSAEGGKVAENVAASNPAAILQFLQGPIIFSKNDHSMNEGNGNSSPGLESVGGVKVDDFNKISGLLEGSNKYVMKCSLNDIMFLVMLIMIKSTSDQRESRMENIISKKQVSQQAAVTVYDLKMKEAEKTYQAEKKQAIMQIVSGAVQVAGGLVSVAGGIASCIGTVARSAGKILSSGLKIAMKIASVAGQVSSIVGTAASIAGGIIGLTNASDRKTAEFARADAERLQSFFEKTMGEIRDMQESYSMSKQNIKTIMDTINEVLSQKQETRLGIARNI